MVNRSSNIDHASMKLGLSSSLRNAVLNKFKKARANQDLLFSDTQLSVLKSKNNVHFQLRYCPALAQKPKDNAPESKETQGESKPDPFANPSSELLVCEVPESAASHFIVLNKYPVIHNHFILATKLNKPQTDLLEENDLTIARECIKAWSQDVGEGDSHRLFAFFNSGEHSGASQVHRHLQFLPVEDMAQGTTNKWQLLMDGMTSRIHVQIPVFIHPGLPIIHFATPIHDDDSNSALYSKYVMLLRAAASAIRSPSRDLFYDETCPIENNGKTTLSYNLAMTNKAMAICPRRAESASVPKGGPESSVAINGTILAGTFMVKDEKEWDILQENSSLLDDMLRTIGYPHDYKQNESSPTRL